MRTYSIMCDHCEKIWEYYNRHTIEGIMEGHEQVCKGPNTEEHIIVPGPLEKAYRTYLGKIPEQLKNDLEVENIKEQLRRAQYQ